jgi:hypothetical protein
MGKSVSSALACVNHGERRTVMVSGTRCLIHRFTPSRSVLADAIMTRKRYCFLAKRTPNSPTKRKYLIVTETV